jgi:hypothetical protein
MLANIMISCCQQVNRDWIPLPLQGASLVEVGSEIWQFLVEKTVPKRRLNQSHVDRSGTDLLWVG